MPPGDGSLVERDGEAAELADALRALDRRRGSLIVVGGPLGVGKTALLHGFGAAAAATGALVLRATAAAVERRLPVGVLRQLCEPAVTELTEAERVRVVAGVSEHVRPLFTAHGSAAGSEWLVPDQQALLPALRHLLTVLGERAPVVLLIDDVQWADEASQRGLGYLVNRLDVVPVLVVVTVREGGADTRAPRVRHLIEHADRLLRPAPLTLDGVRSLVHLVCGEPGTDVFVRACHAMSGGNPLIARCVLAELAAAGRLPTDDSVELVHTLAPVALGERVLARVRPQPEAVHAFLRAVGCLGDAADPDLVALLTGLDAVGYAEVVRSLAQQGLLVPGPPARFVHAAVRAAVDVLTPAAETERLHVAAATLLYRTGSPAEEVAAHLVAVPSQQDAWAVDSLREAAESAAARGAAAAAARYLRRALLDTAAESVDRAELLLELAAVERVDDTSTSVRHILEAVSLVRSVSARASAVARLSPLALATAPAAVTEVVRQVAAECGDADALTGTERELALRMEARVRAVDHGDPHRLADAVRRLRGLDHNRAMATPAGRELLAVLLESAVLTGSVSSVEVARLGHGILALESPTGHAHTAVPMVLTALAIADQAAHAESWSDIALEVSRREHDPAATAVARIGQALVHVGAGRVGEGTAQATAAMASMGERWLETATVAGLLRLATAVELDGREFTAQIVETCGHRTDHPVVVALTRLAAAAHAYAADDLRLALEHLQDCGRQVDRAGWRNPAVLPWRTSAAWVRHRLGDTEAALRLAETEQELALAWGAPATVGRVLRVRGTLTPGPAGLRLLREALDVLDDSENQLERARVHLLLGGRLPQADAEPHLRRGRALVEVCAARWLAERELGAIANPTGLPDPPAGGSLTRAERRVVELAVTGRTNQAIADELGVGSRVVEKHLTSAYRKLSVAGRPQLRDAWQAATVSRR